MTIDEALKIIKDGRIVATAIKGNNEDDTKFNTDNIEALNVIIDTMHKYQKIKDIVKNNNGFTDGTLEHSKAFTKIVKVLENGNDD